MAAETYALLMTDVAGSTRQWAESPEAMDAAMHRHRAIVHSSIATHAGWRPVDQGEGDSVFAAFSSAPACLRAAVAVQQALQAEPWPEPVELNVRIGLHVGEVVVRDGNLYGDVVNRCARIRSAGHGGQILMSTAFYELIRDRLPDDATVEDLGDHLLKDLNRPERIRQLHVRGLPTGFPPLATLRRARHNLTVQPTPFIGRATQLAEVGELIAVQRLVTITGFGGMGKTRLALQVAADVADGDGDGVWFVDLTRASAAEQVPSVIAEALDLPEIPEGPGETLLRGLADKAMLLILDNFEHVTGARSLVAELLRRCPGIHLLATSREPLRIQAEHEYPLTPLAVPRDLTGWGADSARLGTYDAVRLFVDRARTVDRGFAVTSANAPAVAAICARLDGHPLALELAAARLRILSPETLHARLADALSVLTGGSLDMPDRHRTLQATIAWSYDLLPPEERLLLQRLSVFAGPVTLEAIEAVCQDPVPRDGQVARRGIDIVDGVTALVEKNLVRTTLSASGDRVFDLLVSIRDYAERRLAESGSLDTLVLAHADWALTAARTTEPFTPDDEEVAVKRAGELIEEIRTAVGRVDLRTVENLSEKINATLEFFVRTEQITHCQEMAQRVIGELDVRDRPERGDFWPRHQYAQCLHFRGDDLGVADVRRDMLERARRLPWLDQQLVAVSWMLPCTHDREEHAALLDELQALLETVGDHDGDARIHAQNLLSLELLCLDPGRALLEARKLAAMSTTAHLLAIADLHLIAALIAVGALTEAAEVYDALDVEASGRTVQALATGVELCLRGGDLADAARRLSRAELLAAQFGAGYRLNEIRSDLHHLDGDHEAALRASTIGPDHRASRTRSSLRWRQSRALAGLGRDDEAVAALELAAVETRALGVHGLTLGVAVERSAAALGRPLIAVGASVTRLRDTVTRHMLPIGALSI